MNRILGIAIIGAAALLGGCATTGGRAPVDVTRFHLGNPIAGDTVQVQTLTAFAGASPEDQAYIGAVSNALTGLGFAANQGEGSTYIAAVSYKRTSQGMVRKRPPITIGLGAGGGGGSYGRRGGGGVGVGVGGSVGIGGGQAEAIATELSVQLKRRTDNSIVWEGRAVTEALAERDEAVTTPQRLANALFKGFPGESGITITVK
jgi:hypothetical protein